MFSTQKDGKPWIVKKRNVKKPKLSMSIHRDQNYWRGGGEKRVD